MPTLQDCADARIVLNWQRIPITFCSERAMRA